MQIFVSMSIGLSKNTFRWRIWDEQPGSGHMWFKRILILATLEIFFDGKGFKTPARCSLYCFLTHVSCQNCAQLVGGSSFNVPIRPKQIFPRNVTFNRARTNAQSVWSLKPLSETIIAEKQLGFYVGRNTKERFLKCEYCVRGTSRIGQSVAWSPLTHYGFIKLKCQPNPSYREPLQQGHQYCLPLWRHTRLVQNDGRSQTYKAVSSHRLLFTSFWRKLGLTH